MIKIRPKELHLAVRLGKLRGPSPQTNGPRNWQNETLLSYTGEGHLSACCTNNRVILQSRLPVEGEAEPWSVAVEAWRLDGILAIDGGRMALEPKGGSVLVLRSGRLRMAYPIRVDPPANPFPSYGVDGAVAQHSLVPLKALESTLRF